jgi:hypothetical protein
MTLERENRAAISIVVVIPWSLSQSPPRKRTGGVRQGFHLARTSSRIDFEGLALQPHCNRHNGLLDQFFGEYNNRMDMAPSQQIERDYGRSR